MENQKTKHRKVKEGTIVSNKMNKTVVVNVTRTLRHKQYGKVITRGKKYYAHNEDPNLQIGDKVTIQETRPLSKLKRWKVVNNVAK